MAEFHSAGPVTSNIQFPHGKYAFLTINYKVSFWGWAQQITMAVMMTSW